MIEAGNINKVVEVHVQSIARLLRQNETYAWMQSLNNYEVFAPDTSRKTNMCCRFLT